MSIIDEAYEIFDIRIVKKLDNYIDYFYATWFSLGDQGVKVNIKDQNNGTILITMGLDQITTMKAIMAG